jgi:sulfatase modifying factor 1
VQAKDRGQSCCSAAREPGRADTDEPRAQPLSPTAARSTRRQVRIPGGVEALGDHFGEGYAADGETPVHDVQLDPFWMDEHAVTNAQFATFVKATGHTTDAERYGSSAVFHASFTGPARHVLGTSAGARWWLNVAGATWRSPEGPESDIRRRQNHPVVHVSHQDAEAYAAWAGKRLPTEAEWEFAARGGRSAVRYPWGNDLTSGGRWNCNIWQGVFPTANTAEDGYSTTAPVKAFHRNDYGLWQLMGNVWEWCADWFSPAAYEQRVRDSATAPVRNPAGPRSGTSRVMRGGSFLCHESYCFRYRVAARTGNTPESSSSNIGFRCANNDA